MNPIVQQVLHETQKRVEVLEEANKELKKRLDDVTVVVDLMARIEHARKDKIKQKKYLYAHRTNEGDITFEIDEGVSVVGYQYIGKIKLEVDDEV